MERAAGVFQADDFCDAAAAIEDASAVALRNGASEVHIREATEEEQAAWETTRIRAIDEGAFGPNEASDWMVLLPLGRRQKH